mmetsp:Transcript_21803/g.51909  ORF Transcript_21803/g.51909 Transcript_21803/m.51909 type:complete len:92 (+) Transcript_21803:723-998(+)
MEPWTHQKPPVAIGIGPCASDLRKKHQVISTMLSELQDVADAIDSLSQPTALPNVADNVEGATCNLADSARLLRHTTEVLPNRKDTTPAQT